MIEERVAHDRINLLKITFEEVVQCVVAETIQHIAISSVEAIGIEFAFNSYHLKFSKKDTRAFINKETEFRRISGSLSVVSSETIDCTYPLPLNGASNFRVIIFVAIRDIILNTTHRALRHVTLIHRTSDEAGGQWVKNILRCQVNYWWCGIQRQTAHSTQTKRGRNHNRHR